MNLFATRRIDELGRIVLPMELRKMFQIERDTDLNIYADGIEKIVLQKTWPACKICGTENDLAQIAGKDVFICAGCKQSVQETTSKSEA